jgi:hypothetical protein
MSVARLDSSTERAAQQYAWFDSIAACIRGCVTASFQAVQQSGLKQCPALVPFPSGTVVPTGRHKRRAILTFRS